MGRGGRALGGLNPIDAEREEERMTRGRKGGGRPRKPGPRHPSGQLVQKVEPNAKVVELRRALLAGTPGVQLADTPLLFAGEMRAFFPTVM